MTIVKEHQVPLRELPQQLSNFAACSSVNDSEYRYRGYLIKCGKVVHEVRANEEAYLPPHDSFKEYNGDDIHKLVKETEADTLLIVAHEVCDQQGSDFWHDDSIIVYNIVPEQPDPTIEVAEATKLLEEEPPVAEESFTDKEAKPAKII